MNISTQKKGSKRKKPGFTRQQSLKSKLKPKWRRPRGLHSKLRLRKKGHSKVPKIGYGSPKEGLSPEFETTIIYNLKDLENINPKSQAVLIAGSVGKKKKIELLKKIKTLKINVLNVKDIDSFLKKVEEDILKRKESKLKTEEKKKKAKQEAEKKAKEKKKEEKKEKPEEDKTEEEKKEEEKAKEKEKRKVFEKKVTKEGVR